MGYTGCKVVQGTIEDVALTSSGKTAGQQGDTTFQGEDVFFRMDSGKLASFFAKGVSFDSGHSPRCGFQADESIVLYINSSAAPSGMHGMISSKGTKVTFYYPEITSVKLNEKALEVMASDRGWVQIKVPSGTFKVDVVSSYTL